MNDMTSGRSDLSSFIFGDGKETSVNRPSAHALNRKMEPDFTTIGRILPLSGAIPIATAG